MIDKVLHSAVGLGSILTVVIALVAIYIGKPYLVIISPILLAIGKEIIDSFTHGKPSIKDIIDTLNPMIVIKWYLKTIGK